jgi:hypothetical protein
MAAQVFPKLNKRVSPLKTWKTAKDEQISSNSKMKMKRAKLTLTERRVMGRGRRHWSGSRGHHVMLHPRHDALDMIEGLGGLALSFSAVKGRPKAVASGAGERMAVWVPV